MPARKVPAEKYEARATLTAIVLADSFTQKFRPITVQKPKVLLPLVNAPLIEYTLEWLALNGIEEVFVFCCAHADQIKRYLQDSKWRKQSNIRVTTVVSTNCLSAGEALRLLDQKDIVKHDFVLVSGDTVSNMNLAPVLEAHRQRREKDKNAIMTMVMKRAAHPQHRLRLGDTELIVAVDPTTQRLLKYQELEGSKARRSVKVDAAYFSERDACQVRTDLLDTHIAICAPEVLMLFSDNFDYQNLKRDFVSGVLSEEELGNKLYIHELTGEYAARVHNLRSYDAISRDILQRWCFPFVPDANLLYKGGTHGASSYRYQRGHKYLEHNVTLSRSAALGPDVCIGAATAVGDNTRISQSVIGRDCRIGSNVVMEGSYLSDGATVGDNAVLLHAMVCEGAVIKPGATLEPGTIVSQKVVVAAKHTVPKYTRVSLCQQIERQSSLTDDELEYSTAGQSPSSLSDAGSLRSAESLMSGQLSGRPSHDKPSRAVLNAAEAIAYNRQPDERLPFDARVVGAGGAGFSWPSTDTEYARQSIAPPPPQDSPDGGAESEAEGDAMSAGGEASGEDDEEAGDLDPEVVFKTEVSETFLRCVKMRFDQTNAVIELNGLKIAEDRTFADCARYIFTTMLSLCLPPPRTIKSEYRDLFLAAGPAPDVSTTEGKAALVKQFMKQLVEWGALLQRFLRSEDDQVELLLTLEEYCSQEGVFEDSGEQGGMYAGVFPQILQQLYNTDIVSEDAILAWADEKEHADAAERVYLSKAAKFLEWLRTADEDESDTDEYDDEEEDSEA